MKINKEWHEQNKMPKNAVFEQRMKWHLEHLKHCNCRNEIPKKLVDEMIRKGKGFEIPKKQDLMK